MMIPNLPPPKVKVGGAQHKAWKKLIQQQFLDKRRQQGLQLAELAQRDLAQQRALAANMFTQASSQRHQAPSTAPARHP